MGISVMEWAEDATLVSQLESQNEAIRLEAEAWLRVPEYLRGAVAQEAYIQCNRTGAELKDSICEAIETSPRFTTTAARRTAVENLRTLENDIGREARSVDLDSFNEVVDFLRWVAELDD